MPGSGSGDADLEKASSHRKETEGNLLILLRAFAFFAIAISNAFDGAAGDWDADTFDEQGNCAKGSCPRSAEMHLHSKVRPPRAPYA